ncbi:MAG: tetratricopeptide repeat protein [Sediminibacterium sp.]
MKPKFLILLTSILFLFIISASAQILRVEKESISKDYYGLVKSDGKFAVKPNYIIILSLPHKNAFLAVTQNKGIEILDNKTGKIIEKKKEFQFALPAYMYSTAYSYIQNKQKEPFKGQYWILIKDDKYGVYDFDFKPIADVFFDEIKVDMERPGFLFIKEGTQWGVMNDKGTILIAPQYSEIKFDNHYSSEINKPVFTVTNRYKDSSGHHYTTYSVYADNTICYGLSSRWLFASSRNREIKAREFLLANENKLTPSDMIDLGNTYYSYSGIPDSLINLAEAYRWFLQAWKQEKSQYIGQRLAMFPTTYNGVAFPFLDTSITSLSIYIILAQTNPTFYNDIGRLYFFSSDFVTAKRYYEKIINNDTVGNYSKSKAYLGIAKIYKTQGDSKLSITYLDKAKTLSRLSGGLYPAITQSDIDELENGLNLARSNLRSDQVIEYKGVKAAIVRRTQEGFLLSNGDVLPSLATNYKILNESADTYKVKCFACSGTGRISVTVKSSYQISYSTSTLYTGSKVSGDYIKTTTITTPSTYQGSETCRQCYGTKKIYSKR